MPVIDDSLLKTVREYVRAGEEDDLLLIPLISAAKQYLLNAGVAEPSVEEYFEESEPLTESEPVNGELSLYELAVVLYVNMLYNGGKETLLDQAMTSIILQIKTYNTIDGE